MLNSLSVLKSFAASLPADIFETKFLGYDLAKVLELRRHRNRR